MPRRGGTGVTSRRSSCHTTIYYESNTGEFVTRRLDLGLASLHTFRLSWEELATALRALLDSEFDLEWLHDFDIKMANLSGVGPQ